MLRLRKNYMPFYLAATSSTITSIAWRSLYTDHRPLDSITKKPQATAPPKLQRVQKYNLKIIMSWEKASQLPTLSPGGTSQQSLKVTSVKTSRSSSMLSLGTYQSATRICLLWRPKRPAPCSHQEPTSQQPEDDLSEDLKVQLHAVVRNLPVSNQKMQQLLLTTSADPQLQSQKSTIQHGWSEMQQDCQPSISKFWNFLDALFITNDIVFKGELVS